MKAELHYRVSEDRSGPNYSGETCEISSRSLRFMARAAPSPGTMLDVTILWPVAIGGALPLRLNFTGPVLRRDARGVVVLIKRFVFSREGEPTSGPDEDEENRTAL